jgi:hypothetical protein
LALSSVTKWEPNGGEGGLSWRIRRLRVTGHPDTDEQRPSLGGSRAPLGRALPDAFDTSIDSFPECIEFVRRVEDEEAWRAGYPSLEAFYDTQAARHPDIRSYAKVRRDIATISPLHDPGGLPSALLARLRGEFGSG